MITLQFNHFIAMWNDKETDLDLLGHQRIAQTIVEIAQEDQLRPLTVGVYGSWGAGKTSILSLIELQLKNDSAVLCITFNGWLYQGYEDTKSALMELVVHELMKKRTTGNKAIDLGKKIFKRINWLKVAKVGGGLAMTTALGLPPTALFGLPGLLSKTKSFYEGEDKDNNKEEKEKSIKEIIESDDDDWLKEEEATVPAQIQAFRKELQELIQESTIKRLVVLVDDLDRCLPPAVIDILEAIKLFLFIEGTVFVIAADEQMIEYAVRRHFPDLPVSQANYTKHYLEKLIQIPIRVPSLNKLQTQNYIRFLLLQNHLKNDKKRLNKICDAFDKGRDTPYDNKELTYDFINSELGDNNQDLRTVLTVAEQLGSTLAKELRGNPRNIKRFLNTLFLRIKVASIYGLTDKVKIEAMAKLMILERFYSETYELIVAEVINSEEGRSIAIADLEKIPEVSKEFNNNKKQGKSKENEKDPSRMELEEWAKIMPQLKEIDLRPYIFISTDQAISFKQTEDLPFALLPVFEALATGTRLLMVRHETAVKALDPSQAKLIFNQLEKISLKTEDWKSIPKPVEGVLYLVQHHPFLEVLLVKLISSITPKDLGVWVASNLEFFKSIEGNEAKKDFFEHIQQDPYSNKTLKNLISQITAK